jgi:hypothetical protein
MRSSALHQVAGTRSQPDRDAFVYDMGQLWNSARGTSQFSYFAQKVLDRRLVAHPQRTLIGTNFAAYLRSSFNPNEIAAEVASGIAAFKKIAKQYSTNTIYTEWLSKANTLFANPNHDTLKAGSPH